MSLMGVGVCGTGVSTSARLVKQVLDRRQDQLDQFGAIAMQDALPQSLVSLLPASSAGEQPEQPVQSVNKSLEGVCVDACSLLRQFCLDLTPVSHAGRAISHRHRPVPVLHMLLLVLEMYRAHAEQQHVPMHALNVELHPFVISMDVHRTWLMSNSTNHVYETSPARASKFVSDPSLAACELQLVYTCVCHC